MFEVSEGKVERDAAVDSEAQETTDALTRLLLGMTKREVQDLRASVHSDDEFADRVGSVLGEAVERAETDQRLRASLGAVTQRSVLEIAQRQPETLGDAIAPAMGPAIRGMVALSLADLNERVESIIQQSFSVQGLKWRFEAFRSGTPLSDIVLRDTLSYRVEHALLIHRSSGTLLNHAMQPEYKGKDPATVAGMLTAVKHFLEDTFEQQEFASQSDVSLSELPHGQGELSHQFSAGDSSILVKASGELALAVVVRGTQSVRLEQKLSLALDELHELYGAQARSFKGEVEVFSGAQPMLEDCLYAEQAKFSDSKAGGDTRQRSKLRRYTPAIACVSLLLLGLGYLHALEGKRWGAFLAALESQPGVAVSKAARLNAEGAEISGLRDPDAISLAVVAERFGYTAVDWDMQQILSLEPSVTLARAHRLLAPPEGINLRFGDGTLRVTGRASAEWVDSARMLHVPGVSLVDFSKVLPPAAI